MSDENKDTADEQFDDLEGDWVLDEETAEDLEYIRDNLVTPILENVFDIDVEEIQNELEQAQEKETIEAWCPECQRNRELELFSDYHDMYICLDCSHVKEFDGGDDARDDA